MPLSDSWSGYDELTLTNPSSSLTDFTFLINLGALSATWWSNVKSDGGDIRASLVDQTELPVDVISFSAGSPGSGIIAVKYSGTLASSGTQKILIWSGNSGASLPAANATYGQYNAYASTRRAFYWNGGGNDRTSYLNHLTMTGSPTVGGASGPFNGAKATTYNGTSQYGVATASVLTGVPVAMSGVGYPANTTASKTGIALANSATATDHISLLLDNPGNVNFTARSTVGANGASKGTYSANTWCHFAGKSAATNSRYALLNGVSGSLANGTRVPDSINRISVGALANSSPGTYFNGGLAFLSLYSTSPSDDWFLYDAAMLKPANVDQSDFYAFGGWTAATPPPPINSVAPSVTGSLVVGHTLTTGDGSWNEGSIDYYRWEAANDDSGTGVATIAGEVADTLLLTESHGLKYVRSVVAFANDYGSTEAASDWEGPIKVNRYINPHTGSDGDIGTELLPWATLEHAETYINANIGVVETLFIDTSEAPLYVATDNQDFDLSGAGLHLTSATDDYADVRYWELREGSTAVPYDTYYGSSGHPNIWVLVTREFACIWEFMGGRGDNLKWFDHLIDLGISPSATFDDATNLSTLNNTAWSWWTGSDGSDFVTLFNPNGSPNGRQFAVPFRPGQDTFQGPLEITGGRVSKLCIGGFSGCEATGDGLAGTVLQARGGCVVDGNIFYGGCSHLCLSGAGDSVTWQNNIYRPGPRFAGTGGYTPQVWYSEAASEAPTFFNERCDSIFSLRGSVTGSNFVDGTLLGAIINLGNFILGHGAGLTSDPITVDSCYWPGLILLPVAATNSTFGALGNAGNVDRCTFIYAPIYHSNDQDPVVITDSLILLNIGGVNGSHFLRARCDLTLQSCTIIDQNLMPAVSGSRPIFDASQGALTLTINDCICDLRHNNNTVVTNELDTDGTDDYAAVRNIFVGTPTALHSGLTKTAAKSNRTLAQMQSLGYEDDSISDSDNSQTQLSGYRVPLTSVANGLAAERLDAPDRSGTVYASRVTTGAYEAVAFASPINRLSLSLGVGL